MAAPPQNLGFIAFWPEWVLFPFAPRRALYNRTAWEEGAPIESASHRTPDPSRTVFSEVLPIGRKRLVIPYQIGSDRCSEKPHGFAYLGVETLSPVEGWAVKFAALGTLLRVGQGRRYRS
jgi:hypothetical protein